LERKRRRGEKEEDQKPKRGTIMSQPIEEREEKTQENIQKEKKQ